jgi:exo-1,4-beta-D-glucosaminidase
VQLELKNDRVEVVSRNFYWIPASPTIFDWQKTDYTHTPALQHEDLKALLSLPAATVEARLRTVDASAGTVDVVLHNTSHALAFQLCVAMRKEDGSLIAPTLWSDNYIELMPGESRTLTAALPKKGSSNFEVQLSGWNVLSQTLHTHSTDATADARHPDIRNN